MKKYFINEFSDFLIWAANNNYHYSHSIHYVDGWLTHSEILLNGTIGSSNKFKRSTEELFSIYLENKLLTDVKNFNL